MTEWSKIFHYYYRIHYGETSIAEREAELIYLNRYFLSLKEYVAVRRKKLLPRQKAKRNFFKHRAGLAFRVLFEHKKRRKIEKRTVARVEKIHRHAVKLKHFKQYRRLFHLVSTSRSMYHRNLKEKVFAGIRKRRMYKIIKQKVIKMAYQKHYDTLLTKGLESFRRNRVRRLEMRAIILGYEAGFSKMVLAKAFKGLRKHRDKARTKRMQLKYVDRLNTGNCLEKCFTNWLFYARRQKRIRLAYREISQFREEKIKRENLLQMLILFNRKRLHRQLYEEVSEKHRERMVAATFTRWFRRYRTLGEGERLFTEMRELTTRQDLFKLWRIKFLYAR